MRTRMYKVKNNFKNQYQNQELSCDICTIDIDTQEHLLNCKVLEHLVPEIELRKHIKYQQLFGNSNEIIKIAKLFIKICKVREIILKDLK